MKLQKKHLVIPIFVIAIVGLPFLLRFIPKSSEEISSAQVGNLNWRDLRSLDFETGDYPEFLDELLSRPVRIPGFIVPLEDDAGSISEFLLVPSPQACIHVPPPPPNQMIHVFLEEAIPYQPQYRAVFVTGSLRILNAKTKYGAASFSMEGQKVEPFRRSSL